MPLRIAVFAPTARRVARALLCLWLLGACDSSKDSSKLEPPSASVRDGSAPASSQDPSANNKGAAMAGSGSFANTNHAGGSPSAGTTPGGGVPASGGSAGGSGGLDGPASSSAATEGGGDSADAGINPSTQTAIAAGQLTAGEWNDLAHWQFWSELNGVCKQQQDCSEAPAKTESARWKIDTLGRIPVVVKAGDTPVVDAEVTLRDADQTAVWTAHTDKDGHAELFAAMFGTDAHTPYRVEVKAGNDSASQDDVKPDAAHPLAITLPAAHTPAPSLDLMFVVDTTGSMSDELAYLQAELGDVLQKVRDTVGAQVSLRTSVNFYRDHGDDYLLRPFPFTTKVADSLSDLAAQSADGGGDIPEAADEALDDAIGNHDWSAHASARLLFLVLDAPPHDGDANIATLQRVVHDAAAKGVQIIPVLASGGDKSGEFLLRSLAIGTNGTYTFLTDDSGIGGSHLKPTIGAFQVELLNALLVRVISERL